MVAMKRTYDGRPVYPPDSPRPDGAIGWTSCRLQSGAYSVWVDKPDGGKSYAAVEVLARSMRTKKDLVLALKAFGIQALECEKLTTLRATYMCAYYAALWPLREVI